MIKINLKSPKTFISVIDKTSQAKIIWMSSKLYTFLDEK